MRRVIGCMSGTSLDGLDLSLVEIEGHGLGMRARVTGFVERSLGGLAEPLRALAEQRPMSAGEIARLALAFGAAHAEASRELLAGVRADLVAVHGQTVFHDPPASWQMVNPWPIVRAIGCEVVCDLRGADLAAGGQGAPITPLADWVLLRGASPRAVINLGGFCNVTLLPGAAGAPSDVRGMDICACNHVLDGVARRALGTAFDVDGAAARRGTPHVEACADLSGAFAEQGRARRSLGTGDEASAWIERWLGRLAPDDLAASAARALAGAIARAVQGAGEAFVAGGGARNLALVDFIARALGASVRTTDEAGLPMQARESACIAVLGALAQDGAPITLEHVTGRGAEAARAGLWARPA